MQVGRKNQNDILLGSKLIIITQKKKFVTTDILAKPYALRAAKGLANW